MALAAPFPSVRSTVPSTRARQRVRLTRRGRAVVFLGSSLLLSTAVVATGQLANAEAGASSRGPATAVVVVQPGETLWSIAQAVAPNADPRETVQRLRDLNGLGDAVVVVGQSIVVPA